MERSVDIRDFFRKVCNKNDVEESLLLIALDGGFRVIGYDRYYGSKNSVFVEYASVVRFIMVSNAADYILVHNHTNGSIKPSKEDWTYTKELKHFTDRLDVRLLEHIIISGDKINNLSGYKKWRGI